MRKPKQSQVWSVHLTMTLGTEKTEVKHDIPLDGDASEVIRAIYSAANEVGEAASSAANAILASARGFGLNRGEK